MGPRCASSWRRWPSTGCHRVRANLDLLDRGPVRVLWFVNKPLPALARGLGLPDIHAGGWLDGLVARLSRRADLELGVAAVAPRPHTTFKDGGVTYYSLGGGEPVAATARVVERWRRVVRQEEDLSDCLSVIEEFGPDIVHVHGTEGPFGLLAVRSLCRASSPCRAS